MTLSEVNVTVHSFVKRNINFLNYKIIRKAVALKLIAAAALIPIYFRNVRFNLPKLDIEINPMF